jgi:hypothetical protein
MRCWLAPALRITPPRTPPLRVRVRTSMVEGHGTHRVAAAHRKVLVGKAFVASSPNGRFEEGAAAVNGRVLTDVQAHGATPERCAAESSLWQRRRERLTAHASSGKHVFYVFGEGADTVVVHVHFGMAGRCGIALCCCGDTRIGHTREGSLPLRCVSSRLRTCARNARRRLRWWLHRTR